MLVSIPGCLFEFLDVTYSALDEDESDYIPLASNQLRRKPSSDSTLLHALSEFITLQPMSNDTQINANWAKH